MSDLGLGFVPKCIEKMIERFAKFTLIDAWAGVHSSTCKEKQDFSHGKGGRPRELALGQHPWKERTVTRLCVS